MKSLRFVLMMFALCTSAALFAQGPAGGETGAGQHMASVDDQLDNLSQKLSLTDAQKPQVKTILQDQRDKMKQVMDKSSGSPGDARAKMREIHKTANTQIRAILAADQKATFDKMQEEHRKQMEERRGGNDQGAPPPDRL